MAEQKSKAEKAASAAKSKKSTNAKKNTSISSAAKKNGGSTANKTQKLPPLVDDRPVIPTRFVICAVFLILFLLFLISFFQPEGALIRLLGDLFMGLFGKTGFVFAIPVFLFLFFVHASSGGRPVVMRTVCAFAFVLLSSCISHLISDAQLPEKLFPAITTLYQGGIAGTTGGVICGGFTVALHWIAGTVFSYIVLIVAAVLTLLAAMQITIPSIIRAIQNRPRSEYEQEKKAPKPEPAAVVVNHIANKRIQQEQARRDRILAQQEEARRNDPQLKKQDIMHQLDLDVETPVSVSTNRPAKAKGSGFSITFVPSSGTTDPASVVDKEILPFGIEVEEPKRRKKKRSLIDPEPDLQPEYVPEPVAEPIQEPAAEPVPVQAAASVEQQPPIPQIVKPRKVTAKESDEAAAQVAMEIAKSKESAKPDYCFPPIDLLKLPGGGAADGTAEMRENSRRLNETLASFKIEAHIINVTRGPSVTRYEVELEKGVRLSKLTSAADDIALNLGASGVRIAAVPGKISVVGIEVPNRAVTTVSLREVIDSAEFKRSKSKSTFAVGKDIGGSCIVGNIAKLPHMLIAGTTGSGKSVCMNSIIISLLYKASPDDVKLIMVDPKMVELGIYNGIPHLLIPVVTDPKKAAGSLQWAVTEMMRRYKAMSDAGVRDLESYNSIVEGQEGEGNKLPQVVVIIDELADLMLVAAKEVEESICRIAQMGRAAGIHLIIATQRPSADVITGLMKANIPSRIAFAVASAMESRIILDTQGAEKLVGKGDMLFAPIGNGKPRRVQGCFVTDSEVESVATYVKNNYNTTYDQQVMEEIERKAAQTGTKGSAAAVSDSEPTSEELEGDEMLPAAVDVILETGQASVSMLQRRLKLGYARAARIVDEMEEKGIVGPFQGSKPRAILITKEQWQSMRSGESSQMNFEDLTEEPVPEEYL